jgi:hypothetical protein
METGVRWCAGDAHVTRKDCPAIKNRLLYDETLCSPEIGEIAES